MEDLEFSRRARVVANEFGPTAIEQLSQEFHAKQDPPPDLAHLFPGLGQWMAARQFAIFEILYHIGPSSLPLLRQAAYGEYDWTQGNAIEVLCRFAAEGIERDQIISELREAIPGLRYEALVYAIRPLRTYSRTNLKLQRVIDDLLSVPEFKEAFSESF